MSDIKVIWVYWKQRTSIFEFILLHFFCVNCIHSAGPSIVNRISIERIRITTCMVCSPSTILIGNGRHCRDHTMHTIETKKRRSRQKSLKDTHKLRSEMIADYGLRSDVNFKNHIIAQLHPSTRAVNQTRERKGQLWSAHHLKCPPITKAKWDIILIPIIFCVFFLYSILL